jgi:hypothetical protein
VKSQQPEVVALELDSQTRWRATRVVRLPTIDIQENELQRTFIAANSSSSYVPPDTSRSITSTVYAGLNDSLLNSSIDPKP